MLELQHLSKWITIGGIRTFILKDINTTINDGEFIFDNGPFGFRKVDTAEYSRDA